MTEALQIMDDCNYERLSVRRERALKKDIYKFIHKYKSILEWVIEHVKAGSRTDWYERELEYIDDDLLYNFIRTLVSLQFKFKAFRKIIFTFKSFASVEVTSLSEVNIETNLLIS